MEIVRGRQPAETEQRGPTFTGPVWADNILRAENVIVNDVTFPPGSRTNWHRHEAGQILIVLAGFGWVQVRDGAGGPIGPGDVVWFPAGEEHWHGATATTILTHRAISLGVTDWGDPVSDEEHALSAV